MRATIIWVLATSLLVLPAFVPTASADRIGGGLEYDMATGDVDDGLGLFVTYFQEIDELLGYQLGLNYVSGDYSLPGSSGDYTRTGVDAALVFRFPQDTYTTYLGAGAGFHFNDFSGLEIQDKLSIFFLAGAYVDISEDVDLDVSVRYRYLQPDNISPGVDSVEMDSLVVRVGVSWPI